MKFTKNILIELTASFRSRTEFKEVYGAAYHWAKKNRLLDEVFPHLAPIKKRGFWKSKENVLAESRKYKTRHEFKMAARQAYNVALKNGWTDAFEGFELPSRIRKHWQDKNDVLAEANKYKSAQEFRSHATRAYESAKANGWADVFDLFERKVRPAGYWNDYEHCQNAALECSTRLEMRKKFRSGYEAIKTNKWDELFSHMVDPRLGKVAANIGSEAANEGWTLESLKLVASKFPTRKLFMNKRPGAYKTACELGCIDEVCAHMERQGHLYLRQIYAIEFADKSVYIGLTYNFAARKLQHLRYSSNKYVREKISSGMAYEFVQYKDFYSREDAPKQEQKLAELYVIRGYTALNIGKLGAGGSLGGGVVHGSKKDADDHQDIKWSKPLVLQVARSCTSRTQFKNVYSGAWRHARVHGYMHECHKIIPCKVKDKGYWLDPVNVRAAASLCKTRSEFKARFGIAYRLARVANMLDGLFPRR